MKHSDWDIWKEKLDELPVNSDSGLSWGAMQSVLDQNMPLVNPPVDSGGMFKLMVKKIVSAFGHVLPAAAMVTAVTYMTMREPKPEVQIAKKTWKPDTVMASELPVMDKLKPGAVHRDSLIQMQKLSVTALPGLLLDSSMEHSEVVEEDNMPAVQVNYPKQLFTGLLGLKSMVSTSVSDTARLQKQLQQLKISDLDQALPLIKQPKTKKIRLKSVKATKKPLLERSQRFNYGMETGFNTSKSLFLAVSGSYALNTKLVIGSGVRINSKRTVEGSYTHPSYNLNDPDAPLLKTLDTRKFGTVDIPLSITYQISDNIGIKAGPFLSFQLKHGGPGSRLDKIINHSDTVHQTRQLLNAMADTRTNKFNVGFSAGLSFKVKKFSIEASYLKNLNPDKISSSLGSYQKTYSAFTFGVGYRFK